MQFPKGENAPGRMGKLRPPRIGIERLWLLLPFFVVLWKGMLYPIPLMDFWWHLKMGELILANHAIPTADTFSFTASGQAFAIQNWLAESIYYVVYKAGGLPWLIMLNTLLLAAAIAPVYALCRKSSGSVRLGAVVGVITSVVLVGNIRPQVFSVVLFALFYWILETFYEGRKSRIWYLPLLMVLWVNLHGAFAVGIALIALYVACELICSRAHPDGSLVLPAEQKRNLILSFVLTIAATLINPQLHHVYGYVRTVLSDPGSQIFVAEWQPPQIGTLQGFFLFFGFFYALILVLVCSKIRPSLREISLFVCFSAFALTALRNSVWFILVSAPIIAKYLSPMLDSFSAVFARFAAMPHNRPVLDARRRTSLNLAIAVVVALALVVVSPWVRPRLYKVGLYEEGTPVGAMDYISRRDLKGNIFHPQIFGDYLIWRLWPKHRSFLDGRVHLFGPDFIQQYRMLSSNPTWQTVLDQYNVRYLLLSKHPRQMDSLALIEKANSSKNWANLYEDSTSVLLEKRAVDEGMIRKVHDNDSREN